MEPEIFLYAQIGQIAKLINGSGIGGTSIANEAQRAQSTRPVPLNSCGKRANIDAKLLITGNQVQGSSTKSQDLQTRLEALVGLIGSIDDPRCSILPPSICSGLA